MITIRRALADDLPAIGAVVDWGAARGELVALTPADLTSRLEQFWVASDAERVLGICALRPLGEELGEICSLAVWPERQGQGLGGRLVTACLDAARRRPMRVLVTLTFHPEYFERFGFRRIALEHVPASIWPCYAEPDKRLAGSESALRYELDPA